MHLKRLYTDIIKKKESWNYYESSKNTGDIDISSAESCYNFIKEFIELSKKTEESLYHEIDEIYNKNPNRIIHIVSTFFLGLALLNNKRFGIKNVIIEEIERLNVYDNIEKIEKDLPFIWFLAALFHDLGYNAENGDSKTHSIPHPTRFANSVPSFYHIVYQQYYKYRENKDHGIYGGTRFIADMLRIREKMERDPKSERYWGKGLEKIYNYVGWIIIAHNIWFKKKSNQDVKKYENMKQLILDDSKKSNPSDYYKITFDKHPLFFLFCLVDTIEPSKKTTIFSKVNIKFANCRIEISTKDKEYAKAISGLDDWLVPVKKENDWLVIEFQNKEYNI